MIQQEIIMVTKMKTFTISKQTLGILKNFSGLNSNILIKPGNVIKTITPSKNGMAEATVSEDFPVEFGIWDLQKFLGVISLFNSPAFSFASKSVTISDGANSNIVYYYSEPKLLTVPTKNVNMPKTTAKVTLTEKVFADLQRAAAVMQLPDISFQNESQKIYAVICDLADPTSNSYKTLIAEDYEGEEQMTLNFKIDNLRMLPGSYTVKFSTNVVGEFTNDTVPVKYWFAMETNSRFE
jgi:hypothetical protein